ncbi:GNAT family N-acetyltransferase [Cetobacterium sp. 2A]|uniref:GNAT family N-acetyltransferase n=1 Tax=unclassified Cetobacterium TaxID=2630983 RepID=UPI00163C72AB|nr:GNAT family N-acetyltransferase [Cetobacterium sp. 2A]MBC2855558.1 GNAT family N-acetyltransferase [Cetobacterium sp. 2A]
MYKIYTSQEIEKNIKKFKEFNENFILDKHSFYCVLENKNGLIGYADLEKNDHEYILKNIFIRQEDRYKSHGTKIISFLINNKVKKGTLVVKNFESMETFFKKLGFKKENNQYILTDLAGRDERQKEGKKTVYYSIFWNIVLAVTKISAGIFGKSRALLTDGFNSLSDVATSTGILLGIHFSNMPEDEDHPFGHEKIESIIGVGLGIFMIITAFELGKGSIEILISNQDHTIPKITTIFWAGFSSVVKFFMYRQKMRVGIKTGNSALIADAKDSRNDVFSSLGVILGILLSIYISPVFDIIISILVALLIFKEGVSVILETTDVILDKQDFDFLKSIEDYIYENTNISNVHDMVMRKSGDKIFLSLHVRVSGDMSVYESHKIADNLEQSITIDFPSVKSVIVHMDHLL